MITTTPRVRGHAIRLSLGKVGVDVSPEFEAAILPRPREKIVTGGWQAGKSTEGAAEIYSDFPLLDPERLTRDGAGYRYWVVLPSYKSPRTEMEYLRNWTKAMGVLDSEHFPDTDSAKLLLFGRKVLIETKTAQDPEGIAGYPCDGVLVVEAGQMPEVIRTQAQGRIITRRGWITYTGTLEDDEARPRWAWYGIAADQWMQDPSHDRAAYSLPSWANRTVFPGGRADPEIVRQARILDEHAFNRRIGGIPSGVQYPVYTLLTQPYVIDPNAEVPPEVQARWGFKVTESTQWITGMGAGGHDYGEQYGHPSTLGAVTVTQNDVKVVRACWGEHTSDDALIESRRRLMGQRYGIPHTRWGFDPMQREAAKIKGAQVATGDRLVRVGIVEGYINAGKLKFDFDGPGVKQAFAQMQRVHYVKKFVVGQGERYEYARVGDDLAAAVENALQIIKNAPPMVTSIKPSAATYRKPRVA